MYDASGGKDSQKVDFADLVKKEGFFPSYKDIYKQMSQSGWITEAGRTDVVNITHWGIMEAKKTLATGGEDSTKELEKAATRLVAVAREVLVMSEEFSSKMSEETLTQVENKFDELQNVIGKLKKTL
ncbi:MAG: hypothetical protein KDB79_09285 [Acidobacteria bacterium]|nr:hypothetical protein [Acidobacteriota bacterium]